ncbi:urate hydroxylase PuuD [Paracoccus siganidrum]|uniref:urate hydroxylase PuuD n=1 Tax=Paracoccus siganidrum TaxID=1276757 RepID=UPI0026D5F725
MMHLIPDHIIIWEWAAFAIRWLHVITAIAWIGSSFYFVALDLGLVKAPGLPKGAHGEEWQVHGGGFYHIQKYLVAPERMPEHLTWFKWESYATWLSGAALLMVTYWAGANLYLIDPAKIELSTWQAILISGGSLAIGWLIYDTLCKSKLGETPTVLMLLLFVALVVMGWGYNQVFTGRAALLHLGAFTATIMTANVFLVIMPNQRIVVADLKAGRAPDPKYGKIAKLRSTHNNYLTLPVIFLMLSNHYPLAFASEYNWLIAALIFLMGVTIRHFFNTMHARQGYRWWTWAVTSVLFVAIMWLSALGLNQESYEEAEARALTPIETKFAEAEGFDRVADIIVGRCSMCHAREPVFEGIHHAPKGVFLETRGDIARLAREIYVQSGLTDAMPPANITWMEQEERQQVIRWFRQVGGLSLAGL